MQKNSQKETTVETRTHDSFTMTKRLFTHLVSSSDLYQKSVDCSPSAALLPRSGSLRFFLILEIKVNAEKKPFWHHRWHKNGFVKIIGGFFKGSFPCLFCEEKTPLGKMVNREGEWFEGTTTNNLDVEQ